MTGRVVFADAADVPLGAPLPRERDANGHYAIGPKLEQPSWVRLIADRMVAFAPTRERASAAEKRRLGREATRAARAGRMQRARARVLDRLLAAAEGA
jgi:hypothetical protein